jgi:UPF0755 protein
MKRRNAAVLAILAGASALSFLLIRPGASVRVEIPERLSARQTAELLGEKNVVVSVPLFRLILKLGRYDRHLKPGTYSLRVHEWPATVVRKLTLGLNEDVKVLIPEGFRASQIAERLAADGIADAGDFEAYVKLKKFEGKLFPSTYHFPPGYGADRAAARMNEAFEREIAAAYANASPKPELTLEAALTLASIVEREAVLPQERPIIAAMYLNRLKKRMPLQADPTVQYALGHWKKGLTRDDLKTPSPYNTYLHQGLPPGPICSPGLGSFSAVLNPVHTQALYMVADAKGGHNFSETNEEHNKARRAYKHELKKIKEKLKKQSQANPAPAR